MSAITPAKFFLFSLIPSKVPLGSLPPQYKDIIPLFKGGETFTPQGLTQMQLGATTSPPQNITVVGAPTPQQYHLLMGELARLLELRLHKSGRYYVRTDGSPGRYYPQINLSFYVEGRLAENGVDPLQPSTFVLQSSDGRLTFQRRDDRDKPLLHTKLISEMGLTPNDDWTFRRASSPGVTYHLQLDGSIWGSNGITYSLNSDSTIREERNTQPIPFTQAFSQLGIHPSQISLFPARVIGHNPGLGIHQGSFPSPGETGFYLIQTDGSIFYTGRRDGGGTVQACTYVRGEGGRWVQTNPPRREALPSTYSLARVGAYQDGAGFWRIPSNDSNPEHYRVVILGDGRIVRFRTGSDLAVSEYNSRDNTWASIGNRDSNFVHSNTQVMTAMRAMVSPESCTSTMADFDNYISALRRNIEGNEGTNFQISSRFYMPQNTHASHMRDIAQLVSFTRNGTTYYRLLIVTSHSGNDVHYFREFDFTQNELQRIAGETSRLINWNDINSVRNWFANSFRFQSNPMTAYAQRSSGQFYQLGEIRNLRMRYIPFGVSPNPLQIATQRLGEISFNQEANENQIEGNFYPARPENYNNFVFHRFSEGGAMFGSYSDSNVSLFGCASGTLNISTPIPAGPNTAIRDQIIQRFENTGVRHAFYSFSQGNDNYLIAVGDRGVHFIMWRTEGGTTCFGMWNYNKVPGNSTNIVQRLNSVFPSSLTMPDFRPSTYPSLNVPQAQNDLRTFVERFLIGVLHRSLNYDSRRSGTTLDHILPANPHDIREPDPSIGRIVGFLR